jgi:4-amino-4-deoxy-L-arabinose transferase-like glycosyltransferase
MPMKKIIQYLKDKAVYIFLLLSMVVYFSFGSFHLAQFVTADEHFWFYERIPQYWKAIGDQNWKKTRVNDKPGISVALLGGTGLLLEKNPEKFEMKDIVDPDPNRTETSLRLNAIFRWPILVFNGFFSLYLFYVLRKNFKNKWPALFATLLIILSPTLLGISQIVNPDSLMWSFSAAAIFSFMALLVTDEKKFFILSPLFFSLALLSKYSAAVLYPFFFAALLIYFFIEKTEDKNINFQRLKSALWGYLTTVVGSLIFFALFMPAVFTKYQYLTEGTMDYPGMRYILIPIGIVWVAILLEVKFNKGKVTNWVYKKIDIVKKYLFPVFFGLMALIPIILMVNTLSGLDFLKIHDVPFDVRQGKDFVKGTTFIQKIFLEFRQLTFSLQPFVLLGIIWLWIRAAFFKIPYRFFIFLSSIFILIYYLAVITQDLLANIRYSIMLYPIAIALGALGIWDFFETLKKPVSKYAIAMGIVAVSVFSLWQAKPFYFNYTNSLLPSKYIITGAWGYGGYEAAEFINSQPNPENLRVWTDYQGACEFIKGMCMTKNYKYNTEKYQFDYFIFSRRGQILDEKKSGNEKPIDNQPVWSLEIGGRPQNFIQVYKAKGI